MNCSKIYYFLLVLVIFNKDNKFFVFYVLCVYIINNLLKCFIILSQYSLSDPELFIIQGKIS